jgi:hypothetical protein
MGKKDKPAGKKGSEPSEDLKRDQKLQAIVLADSFMKTFRPISWEKPKALAIFLLVNDLINTLIELKGFTSACECSHAGLHNRLLDSK